MPTYQFETDHVFSAANEFMTDNGITVPVIDLSQVSGNVIAAFVQRGINHVYGNVPQSSAYSAAKKLLAKQAGHEKVNAWEKTIGDAAAIRKVVRTWRAANPEEAKRLAAEAVAEAHKSVVEGTLQPERATGGGETVDPVVAVMRELALENIRKAVKDAGGALPRKYDTVCSFQLPPDADHDEPWSPTVNDLIARQFAKGEENYRKQAEALIAAKARAASRVAGDTLAL